MTGKLAPAILTVTLAMTLAAPSAFAGDLVRIVRSKLAAGDLASGIAAVEDYRKATGVDAEYLDAVGWLARGSEMLRRPEQAKEYVAELRREIPRETPELVVPLGAAIEVQARLLASQSGRGAAIRYLQDELAHATALPLRSRINKNINMLSLEGEPAPPLTMTDFVGAKPPSMESLAGTPVLLFFFAAGCGDCKAQAPSLARVWQKYKPKGLTLIAVTRYYGSMHDKTLAPPEEKAEINTAWNDIYAGLDGVPAVIDTEGMVRYGASATPTFALIDRKGLVRLYTPTRLSEAELSRRIDEVLEERP